MMIFVAIYFIFITNGKYYWRTESCGRSAGEEWYSLTSVRYGRGGGGDALKSSNK
jgi:hypothetical protein